MSESLEYARMGNGRKPASEGARLEESLDRDS